MRNFVQITNGISLARRNPQDDKTHVGQPSMIGSTGRAKMAASGSFCKAFSKSFPFFSLTGMPSDFLGFDDCDEDDGIGSTSFSFPFIVRGASLLAAREEVGSTTLSFLALSEATGGLAGGGTATLILVGAEEGPGGEGRSFLAGVASDRISSSSTGVSTFFRFVVPLTAVGLSFSFSDVDRCRFSSFSRSMARTSWRIS